jgi:beta-lactamase superfamily II metal-dependent hydrolase
MAKFTALPVRKGDAFLLESEEGTVLVDGGISKSALPGLLAAQGHKSVDVLVCTHNDDDHANGVLGFLDSALKCGELWLPDRWASLLPALLPPLPEVVESFLAELKDMPPEAQQRLAASFGSSWEIISDAPAAPLPDESSTRWDGWPEACLQALDEASAWTWSLPGRAPLGILCLDGAGFALVSHVLGSDAASILTAAIPAAERIRALALLAYERGISVRWFKFDPSSPGGGLPWLQPMNSRQVLSIRMTQPGDRILPLLALSMANKESLAFWAPRENNGGVLFTADTDLSGVDLRRLRGKPIVTVPHHGSEDNSGAIAAVLALFASHEVHPLWVRSDSQNTKRPGPAYLALPKSTRHCTVCRGAQVGSGQEAIKFHSRGGTWVRSHGTKQCTCQ